MGTPSPYHVDVGIPHIVRPRFSLHQQSFTLVTQYFIFITSTQRSQQHSTSARNNHYLLKQNFRP
jgi:hypothetical protein